MANKFFSVNEFREQFPILAQQMGSHPLIYLDNAATTQKPSEVIDAISHYYLNDNANVHRASHQLSNRATTAFEKARETVCQFINARSCKEIVWTKGTTEGFNLLTHVFSSQLRAGDEVIISTLEHHANIVPWQMLVEKVGIKLKVIPLTDEYCLDIAAYQQLLSPKTKFVSVAHISNALGIINPIEEMISLAHQVGAQVIIDGAQAVAHLQVDVQALDCDYYLFSAHKLFGPTGVGVLYGKQHLLDALPPWQGGGEMIKTVSFTGTTYNDLPFKFEAGTPNIAGVIGLASAIDFVNSYDRKMLMLHEQMLLSMAESALISIPEITVLCAGIAKSGAISFTVDGEHHSDIAMLLDAQGIAVRSGSHCAMPLLSALNCIGTVRVSFSLYNTLAEVTTFINALKGVISLLKE
ncbi:cysteine desulfurase CsdA [Psychromonas sp. psych-6C06]|uniref:aminotransferase class V-fold PLP-dependent enzyme n=1 Tax=Psychromonas sp. psych-6C06 TaxID=2058089 RepID=UPI000C3499E0|nr:cysteine desulfurase [Psychromonas sp. psych-6C06]PKF61975.1 cysteine desulfurase CsdA [Psychromonas sp. psych-6C06]